MKFRDAIALSICLALPASSFADFTYTETTKITGGSIVSLAKFAGAFSKQSRQMTDPVESTILVKGNRMAHINPDHTQIIDLDKETITEIDHQKKQYSVVTFQQMKQQMQDAVKKAQEHPATPTTEPKEDKTPPPEMKFKVDVTNTGATKDVAGLSAKESILKMALEAKDQDSGHTGAMAITNDMWMVPEVPGYKQVNEFNKKMAVKMGDVFSPAYSAFSPALVASQPGMSSGFAGMAKEMSKLQGVPVSQIMRLGTTMDGTPLPAASEAPLPKSTGPSASDVAQNAASNAATSATNTAASNAESKVGSHMGSFGGVASSLGNLGGLGGFHKKKPAPAQPDAQPAAAAAPPNAAVLMESSMEMTNFSSNPVDASRFDVPAGYTKIATDAAGTAK